MEAKSFGIRKGAINGSGMGLVFFIMFGSYALAFWYGNQLVMQGEYSAGEVLTVSASVSLINILGFKILGFPNLSALAPRSLIYFLLSYNFALFWSSLRR